MINSMAPVAHALMNATSIPTRSAGRMLAGHKTAWLELWELVQRAASSMNAPRRHSANTSRGGTLEDEAGMKGRGVKYPYTRVRST